MAVFNNINDALTLIDKQMPDAIKSGRLLVATQFAMDAKEQYIAFLSGNLGDSGLKTPKNLLSIGVVRWKTPYALLRYNVNYKTPNSVKWDVKTWGSNIQTYEQQMAKAIEKGVL